MVHKGAFTIEVCAIVDRDNFQAVDSACWEPWRREGMLRSGQVGRDGLVPFGAESRDGLVTVRGDMVGLNGRTTNWCPSLPWLARAQSAM